VIETPIDALHIGTGVHPAGGTYGPYSNPFWEFCWIMEGGGTATFDGARHELAPDSILLLPPGTENFYQWPANRPVRQGLVLFHAPVRTDWPRFRVLDVGDIVFALFRHAIWLTVERPASWGSRATQAIDFAVRTFVEGKSDAEGVAPPFSETVQRIVAMIRLPWGAGPARTPSLRDMAAHAGVSREHLCRVFARELGMGPVSALRLIRVGRAATLLAQSNLSVAEVSRAAGFESEFHFSRTFKAATGMSPSAFRASDALGFDLPAPLRRFASHL
jgi:AraC family transcriptional regulator